MGRNSSLESRLCFLVTGLLVVLLLAVCRVQMADERETLVDAKLDKYYSLAKALSLAVTARSSDQEAAYYRQVVSRFIEVDSDISHVALFDSQGRVLFAKTREDEGATPTDIESDSFGWLIRWVGQIDNYDFERVKIPTMVRPGEKGVVAIRFGSRSVDAAIEEATARMICAFAVACIIGLLAAVFLARSVARPLRRLITATRSVTKGNLDAKVEGSFVGEMQELAEAFNNMVGTFREGRNRLIEKANSDGLTGLYNHKYFHERLRSEIKRSERYSRPLSVIMLDIDHFKTLNDTHGHQVGDTVLNEIARVLQSEVRRDIDIIARYGGEEFALILPETEAENAMRCAEQLRSAVQSHSFVGKDGATIAVTISLGVAQYPIHSSEREGLIMAADLAMYQSKSTGRNRVTMFTNDSRTDNTDADPYNLYLLLQATDVSTIEAMAAAVDAKGQRYPGFSRNVVNHAVALSNELGLSEREQNDVRIAGLLHDIGKLGIADSILNKREPLTAEELKIIRSHPEIGYAIVQRSTHLKSMLPGILHHHEWWNGRGYPHGLKDYDIPLIARLIAVVDSYHAMMTERPHMAARTPQDAKAELKRCAGTQFDPDMVRAFIRVLEKEDIGQAA